MNIRQTAFAAVAYLILFRSSLTSASPSLNLPLAPTAPTVQQAPVGPVPKVANATPPGLGAPKAVAATTAQAKPTMAAPQPTNNVTAAAISTGASTPVARESTTKSVAQPATDRAPTLGDWEDLYQRKAFQAQVKALTSETSPGPQTSQPAMQAALPPLPPPQQRGAAQLTDAPEKKTNRRFSPACPDDNKPCFFSVYGIQIEGGENNFRGQLAINGRVVSVYKGKKFDGYTITDVSDSALTATKGRARYVWPLYAPSDFEADPRQLEASRPQTFGAPSPIVPNNPFMR